MADETLTHGQVKPHKWHDNGDGSFSPTVYSLGGGATTPSTVRNGKTTVTTAGTRVALSGASVAVQGVVIQALASNTGIIYVGSSTVAAANGYELVGGQAIGLAIDDLSKVYIDASVNGDGVSFLGS